MFFKRKREGTIEDGIHWEHMDDIYYLKRILETQNKILDKLENIDKNVTNKFCSEKEKIVAEMNKLLKEGNFNKSQTECLSEICKLSRKYPDDKFKLVYKENK